ncbi:MAG: hypothetical protein IPJ71_13005 [Bdellovibrionales bacterium]|nr:hypothetical protein [Bdellovibrionales bacterium]
MPHLCQWMGTVAIVIALNQHRFALAENNPVVEVPSSRSSDIAAQSGDLEKEDGETLLLELAETENLERELKDSVAEETIKKVIDRNPAWFSLPPANSENAGRSRHQDGDVDEELNAFYRGRELLATPVPKLSTEELGGKSSPSLPGSSQMTQDKTTKSRKFITITFK